MLRASLIRFQGHMPDGVLLPDPGSLCVVYRRNVLRYRERKLAKDV